MVWLSTKLAILRERIIQKFAGCLCLIKVQDSHNQNRGFIGLSLLWEDWGNAVMIRFKVGNLHTAEKKYITEMHTLTVLEFTHTNLF